MKALSVLVIYTLGAQAHAGLKTPDLLISDTSSFYGSERCATTRSGITCYQNDFPRFEIRDVKQPTAIVMSGERLSFCALTSDGVRCFKSGGREVEAPRLKNPRQLTGDRGTFCALDDNGATCWNYRDANSTTFQFLKMPELKNPRMLSLNLNYYCALDDAGATCWELGHHGYTPFEEVFAKLKNPTRIAASNSAVCVRDSEGDKCWRVRDYHYTTAGVSEFFKDAHFKRDWEAFDQRLIVNKQNPEFNLDQIGALTDLLAKVTPPGRARFFRAISANVVTAKFEHFRFEDHARYLLLRLMEPVILGYNSPYFTENLVPAYRKSLASIEHELGMQNISKIERIDRYREIALRTMYATLPILMDFMDLNQRAEVDHVARLIGQAILDAQNVPALTQALDKADPILISLEQNPKAASLTQVIRLAAEWVKGN